MAGLLAAVVWVSPAMAAPRESMLGLRGHQGQAIVAGSDGAMWMVDTGQTFTVVRIPVGAGRWRSSPLPGPGGDASTPAVVGSDGSVWFGGGPFQSQTAASLVRTQRSGRVSVFPAGFSGLGELVAGLVAGPGDDLWFTGFGDRSSLSRISVDGRVRVVVSSRDFKAFAAPLAYGADGAFWVNSGRRVTPGGRVTHVRTGGDTIVAGADGNLWLGGYGGLYRVTTSDQTTAFAWSPRPDGADPGVVRALTPGPDGNIWFVKSSDTQAGDAAGMIDRQGRITLYPLPAASRASAIAAGPDGRLWIPLNDPTVPYIVQLRPDEPPGGWPPTPSPRLSALRLSGGSIRVRVRCRGSLGTFCRGRLQLRVRGGGRTNTLARSLVIEAGGQGVDLQLHPAGLSALARRSGTVTATANYDTKDFLGRRGRARCQQRFTSRGRG